MISNIGGLLVRFIMLRAVESVRKPSMCFEAGREEYPHNHELGAEIFSGNLGRAPLKYRIANLLSGWNPGSRESALSLICVAKKRS